jgi:hypothetical protein
MAHPGVADGGDGLQMWRVAANILNKYIKWRTPIESFWEQGDERIFGHKRDEGTGSWRRLHNGDFQSSHASPNIIRVIKSRRMKLVGHVARMRQIRNWRKIFVEETEGKTWA